MSHFENLSEKICFLEDLEFAVYLEPVKQPVFPKVFDDNPAYYIAQQNSEAREKIKDVKSNHVLRITNNYQVNPVSIELTKK